MLKKAIIFLFAVYLSNIYLIKGCRAFFTKKIGMDNNFFGTGCWTKPIEPTFYYPSDNIYTNKDEVVFQWNNSTNICSSSDILYNLEIGNKDDRERIVNSSGWINRNFYHVNGLYEGKYWWHLKIKDKHDNITVSNNRFVFVDKTAPNVYLKINGPWSKDLLITENVSDSWITSGYTSISDNIIKIGYEEDSVGNYVWENRVMQPINPGAKSLYFQYDFFTQDYSPFDDPGFFVRINGDEIFSLNTLAANPEDNTDGSIKNTGWKDFYFDLSRFNEPIDLIFYSGNTYDILSQLNSWVNIKNISTSLATAPINATYNINSINQEDIDYFYRIDEASWLSGSKFTINIPGTHYVSYMGVDKAGNTSLIQTVKIIVDDKPPGKINLTVDSVTENSVILTWKSPANNFDQDFGRSSTYEVGYTKVDNTQTDCSMFNFNESTKLTKIHSPKPYNQDEFLETTGLSPDTKYCFSIRSADEAPNWSETSNPVLVQTSSGQEINYGDIVINEIMWAGSSISPEDIWLELANTTDRTIRLDDISITSLINNIEETIDLSLSGKTIKPHGYYLIAKKNDYGKNKDSQLNVPTDIWSESLNFDKNNFVIKIYYSKNNNDHLIDQAWNGGAASEGLLLESENKFFSMERVSEHGDGSNPLSWYTCIDPKSTGDFFDGGADERGTPGADNRSDNEPFKLSKNYKDRSSFIPEVKLIFKEGTDMKTVSFIIDDIAKYVFLTYELTYESDSGTQGLLGEQKISNLDEYKKNDLILGTCSTGGSCIIHSNPHDFRLKIKLTDNNNQTITIESKQ